MNYSGYLSVWFSFLFFSSLQYKGAHVKPGFAEHFYSNPARYKGRDNMFVSEISNIFLFISPYFRTPVFNLPCDVFSSTMTPLRMLSEGVRSLTLTAWYSSTLVFTQTNGSTLSRLSQWSELVCVSAVMATISLCVCLVSSLICFWFFCSSWKSSWKSHHWEHQRLNICIHGRLRRRLRWIHDHQGEMTVSLFFVSLYRPHVQCIKRFF